MGIVEWTEVALAIGGALESLVGPELCQGRARVIRVATQVDAERDGALNEGLIRDENDSGSSGAGGRCR